MTIDAGAETSPVQVFAAYDTASPSSAATDVSQHLPPWYHSSAGLLAEAQRLVGSCNGALALKKVTDSDVTIDVATVRRPGTSPSNRVFIMFGEHSRELISPESGLYLLRLLCNDVAGSSGSEILLRSEFQLVLNGNPRSRRRVESGEFCLRSNPSGVDLNRNWDEKWSNVDSDMHNNPGPSPFSEPETRMFRQLVTEYAPTTFLTVHSGTRGLYMPWAYDTAHLANRNRPQMMDILRTLDAEYCQCPYGAAGKEVGYACPGTSLDWAYDHLQTPFSFAFEIYTTSDSDAFLRARWEQKLRTGGAQLLEAGEHLGHGHFAEIFKDPRLASDFVQTRAHHVDSLDAEDDPAWCFAHFNPDTEALYNGTVAKWAHAYLDMAEKVAQALQAAGSGGPS